MKVLSIMVLLVCMQPAVWAQKKVSPDGQRYVYYAAVGEHPEVFTVNLAASCAS